MAPVDAVPVLNGNNLPQGESVSQASQNSQTAAEFIDDQLRLEADAREVLPYAFDRCTQPLGPLKQTVFSCLTCNPPQASPDEEYSPAGLCYSCSIACHGEHTLVELFSKRSFVCDCGTTRVQSSTPCSLRINQATGTKGGCRSEQPASGNHYNHNFQNKYCSCNTDYDTEKEKGTMYQCLGLAFAEDGGCGEDWWHPGCLVGLTSDWYEKQKGANQESSQVKGAESNGEPEAEDDEEDDDPPSPPGFPDEESFSSFVCWKCLEVFPWLKRYAGTAGFLDAVSKNGLQDSGDILKAEPPQLLAVAAVDTSVNAISPGVSGKRKAESDEEMERGQVKKAKSQEDSSVQDGLPEPKACKYKTLPPPPTGTFSLFLKSDFRDHLCRCAECFPGLANYPQLLEEEYYYQPPLSESGDGAGSGSTIDHASVLRRGEQALENVDRVRAIEGVMVYNDLKDKVKAFLKPFAETGKPVSADDIKQYFEKLRGDTEAMKAAKEAALDGAGDGRSDHRREQRGEHGYSVGSMGSS